MANENVAELEAPTFLCLGIQKAGTSWLYRMVSQHPLVHTSDPKELHFFNRDKNFRKGLEWYLGHFRARPGAQAAGEFTPDYLWIRDEHRDVLGFEATPDVPRRVVEVFPDLKFIVILRNPVTRAISSYYHHIGAARLSPNRRISAIGDQWGILSMGHYAACLERWLEHFPRERFLILFYEEDLGQERQPITLTRVFEHIGVAPSFTPTNLGARYNPRRSHFDYRLARLPGRLQKMARRYVPSIVERLPIWDIPIAQDEVTALEQYYRPHNERLEALLGRTIPW